MSQGQKKKSSYEDLQSHVRNLKMPEIEVWENQYADREYQVDIEIPEFTCICPKTGLPDFATIKISYVPRAVCLELKSLKMYIVHYRNIGIFHEHLVNRMLDDLRRACDPAKMQVEAVMNPRGGIATTVRAQYQRRRS